MPNPCLHCLSHQWPNRANRGNGIIRSRGESEVGQGRREKDVRRKKKVKRGFKEDFMLESIEE